MFHEAKPDEEFEPLRPLVPNLPCEPFPVEALPTLIREAVQEVIDVTQAPEALVATCALGALSAAVQGVVNVARNSALIGPASLNTLIVASSGERKTTVDTLLTRGLRDWERRKAEAMAPLVKQQAALVDAWAAQEAGLKDALRKAARDHEERAVEALSQELVQHALKRPPSLHVPTLLRQDDTPERLVHALREYPMAAIISSEAGIIFGSHGMSQDVVMRNLAQMNVFWDGGALQRGRISTGDVTLEGARVTMSLQIQPEAFAAFYAKSGKLARGMGYFARFCLAYPASTQGDRFYKDPPPGGLPALDAFNARLATLLDLASANVDQAGVLRPQTLSLDTDPAAKHVWTGYYDSVEEELSKGREYFEIQDAASKSADNAARLWALFKVCEGDASGEGMTYMVAAQRVARWYLNEALRFARTTAIPESIQRAALLEEWVCKRCINDGVVYVTQKSISQFGPNPLRPLPARDEAIDILVDHGRAVRGKLNKKHVLMMDGAVLKEHGGWRKGVEPVFRR